MPFVTLLRLVSAALLDWIRPVDAVRRAIDSITSAVVVIRASKR